jgi:phosphatidylserine/phosphatidylglycerophosphate/cardiolipin synthase-like enzyme
MAKILTTKGSAAALEEIIRKAEKKILLISYSFKISDKFFNKIKQAVDRNVVISVVSGTQIGPPDVFERLKQLPNIKFWQYENLHAKVFANELKCVVGSMNFSEPSEIKNLEIGVMLSLTNDPDLFHEVMRHCDEILDEANLARPMMPKSILDENKKKVVNKQVEDFQQSFGYCIRTGEKIPLNHDRPYSPRAYEAWLWKGGNENFGEKYDHFTGEQSQGETCKASPVLNKNWKKYLKAREKNHAF